MDYVVAIRNRSDNTVRSYPSDLRMFFRYVMVQRGLAGKQTPFDEIALDDVSEELIRSVTYDDLGLEDFDFKDVTLPPQLTPERLSSCDFVSNRQNLIHYGPPGTGKTHLAIALGMEACKQGHRVLYTKTSAFGRSWTRPIS